MRLQDLLKGVKVIQQIGEDKEVVELSIDSREIEKGFLFAALKGYKVDGHRYIDAALAKGAAVVLCETIPERVISECTIVQVEDSRHAIGVIADNFFNHPSTDLKCIGVTGTNGKTTITTLLYGLFKELGYSVGLISTIEILVNEKKIEASLTTPDVISLHRMMKMMVDEGVDYVFMEVSSHAADQKRIAGLHFAGAVFSNITRDHLDYHGSFKAYIRAKQLFFEGLSHKAFALTNVDDKNGGIMLETSEAQMYTYGLQRLADYKAKVIHEDILSTQIEINGLQFLSRLVGRFNVYNLLAAYAVADIMEVAPPEELLKVCSGLTAAKGRLELVHSAPKVYVDYAHTPDALENVLRTLRSTMSKGKLIVVVGAGGDRDKGKRPLMTRVSLEYSDNVFLTSDNPRSEDPADIINEMVTGFQQSELKNVIQIIDRFSAIKTALMFAKKEDVVLIAGKGHEQYQEINGKRNFFSDQAIVKEILND